MQQVTVEYFAAVHPWFPIVSRKRMSLGLPLRDGGPDLAMLFLAMKLIASVPADGLAGAADPVYAASKRFLALLECRGATSLLHLQAMLLVALYEYGQAVFPAAWMTIGACARYADMLGLPSYPDSASVLGQSVSHRYLLPLSLASGELTAA